MLNVSTTPLSSMLSQSELSYKAHLVSFTHFLTVAVINAFFRRCDQMATPAALEGKFVWGLVQKRSGQSTRMRQDIPPSKSDSPGLRPLSDAAAVGT